MNQSGDGQNGRQPEADDWAAINSVGQAPRPTTARSREASQPKQYSIPQDVQSIDFQPKGYRSYSGLVVLLLAGLVGGGIYYGYSEFPTAELDQQKPIIFSSTEKLSKAVNLEKKAAIQRAVEFETTPKGARVIVNGNALETASPASTTFAHEFKSHVRFSLEGHAEHSRLFETDEARVAVTLEPKEDEQIEVKVVTNPPGVDVYLDGRTLGQSPVETKAKRGLEAVFLLKKADHYARTVVLPTENVKRLNVGETLTAGVTPMVQGTIRVVTQPENAMIERKNSEGLWIKAGRSGFDGIKLTQNVGMSLSVRASAEGYETKPYTIDVKTPFYTVNLNLKEKSIERGDLELKGPKNLMVFLDNEELDKLPHVAKQRKVGSHSLVVVDPKTRKRLSTKVQIKKDQVVSFELESDAEGVRLKALEQAQ